MPGYIFHIVIVDSGNSRRGTGSPVRGSVFGGRRTRIRKSHVARVRTYVCRARRVDSRGCTSGSRYGEGGSQRAADRPAYSGFMPPNTNHCGPAAKTSSLLLLSTNTPRHLLGYNSRVARSKRNWPERRLIVYLLQLIYVYN